MKKELLAATALTAVAFAPGAVRAQTAVPFSWTGVYAGLAANADLYRDTIAWTNGDGTQTFTGSPRNLTVAAGANWGRGWGLLGVEGDYTNLNIRHIDRPFPGDETDTSLRNLLTFRARAGVQHNRLLLYGTGGLALGTASLQTSGLDFAKAPAAGSRTTALIGWTAGGGVEIGTGGSTSIKLEALYYKLNTLTVHATGIGSYNVSYSPQGWLIRVGVNFRLPTQH